MTHTKPFKDLNKGNADIAGGKGASLGEMTQAEIPVPNGFIVLADTFEKFIRDTDLIQEIDTILNEVDHKVIHTVDDASEKIQGLIEGAQMPQDIADEILSSFNILNTEFVAVRSSATAEDGQDHAWAGQLDSYLNITKEHVLEKVQHCWASLFTPRAIFYRFEKGLDTTKISVAVVVQKMVNSEVSGIAFSVHPVTEDRNQLIIEAGFGLGEAIVSGQITPDSYVVEKEPRNILDVNVSEQSRGLFRKQGGDNEWRELGEQGKQQVLTETQINELSNIILTIENHYKFPCDIEWAFESGKFYIVQSRPITTLSNKDINLEDSDKWINVVARNYYPLHSFAQEYQKYEGLQFGKLTWKFNDSLVIKYGSPLLEMFFSTKPDAVKTNINDFLKEPNKDIEEALELIINEIKDNLNTKPGEDFSDLIGLYSKLKRSFGLMIIGYNWISPVDKRLEEIFGKEHWEKVRNDLFHPFEKPTINREHEAIMLAYKNYQKTLNQTLLEKEALDLSEKFGFVHSEYRAREWKPEDYLQEIKNISPSEIKMHENTSSLSEIESWLVNLAQKIIYIYDEGKAALVKTNWALRKTVSNLGFTEQQILNCTEKEFIAWTDGASLPLEDTLKTRDTYHAILLHEGIIKEYLNREDVEKLIQQEEIKEFSITSGVLKELNGSIAWKGRISGRVRIVYSQKDSEQFEEGEILVASMTTPELIGAMRKAAAFVTDEGGITSHAAIIARELNKPCVTATKIATKALKNGDLVEVDADNGIIRILNS